MCRYIDTCIGYTVFIYASIYMEGTCSKDYVEAHFCGQSSHVSISIEYEHIYIILEYCLSAPCSNVTCVKEMG
jgi:hypothetical protein